MQTALNKRLAEYQHFAMSEFSQRELTIGRKMNDQFVEMTKDLNLSLTKHQGAVANIFDSKVNSQRKNLEDSESNLLGSGRHSARICHDTSRMWTTCRRDTSPDPSPIHQSQLNHVRVHGPNLPPPHHQYGQSRPITEKFRDQHQQHAVRAGGGDPEVYYADNEAVY